MGVGSVHSSNCEVVWNNIGWADPGRVFCCEEHCQLGIRGGDLAFVHSIVRLASFNRHLSADHRFLTTRPSRACLRSWRLERNVLYCRFLVLRIT